MTAAWQPRALGIFKRATEDDNIYIPHPAPSSMIADDEDTVNMAFLSVVKTLVVPAIISLILYLVVSYVVVPILNRYRGRYSQYLPLDTISTRTSSIRQRVLDTIARWVLPSAWRSQFQRDQHTARAEDGSGSDFDEEDGEELYDVDDNRREALSLDARRGRDEDSRRLSRDLEEGFKDDSDEEDEGRQGRALLR